MRLLLDNTVSWRVGRWLRPEGHDVIHVADLHLDIAVDPVIYQRAVDDHRTLVTRDADFGAIHTTSKLRTGVLLIRLSDGRPRTEADVLREQLPALEQRLVAGAFAVVSDDGVLVFEGTPS